MEKYFTSESVSSGHPDKVADQISDAILDEILKQDKKAHVACETLVTTGLAVVSGEISTNAWIDIQKTVRDTINDIGYDKGELYFDGHSCAVINTIHEQSADIDMGVSKKDEKMQGAGDQGIMFGYAIKNGIEYMPLEIMISHKILQVLETLRKGYPELGLRPDAKSQVTIEYFKNSNDPKKIDTIIVSQQHDENLSQERLTELVQNAIHQVEIELPKWISNLFYDMKILINPTGRFVIGGPHGDTGLTGRKIIVDTYGGKCPHGGGAFCVDSKTEYLTKEGWKKINSYNGTDLVAQYNDGKLEFVYPFGYIQTDSDKMYRIHSNNSLDMVLSQNHDVVFKTSKGNIVKKQVKHLIENGQIKNGNFGKIPVSFEYDNDNKGIDMTDDEIRLQVAFCADGTLKSHTPNIRIKKKEKIERLEELLLKTGRIIKRNEGGDGATRYPFNPPVYSKSLSEIFKNANKKQMQIIAEEVVLWDGNRKDIFRTTNEKDADFIQFVFMCVYGTNASKHIDDRTGEKYCDGKYERKSICYEIHKNSFKETSFRKNKTTSKIKIYCDDFEPEDKKMYCFTVPSGMLILRRNGKVFVTGNSGKDPSKVDRSAAYFCRWIAKNLVAAGIADEITIQVSYAIGVAQPISIFIDTHGTNNTKYSEAEIAEMLRNNIDFTPYGIINRLQLLNPIYLETAKYGHFGRKSYIKDGIKYFPWEDLDLVDTLKEIFK